MNANRTNVRTAILSSSLAIALMIVIAVLTADPVSDTFAKRASTFFTDDTGGRGIYLVLQKVLSSSEQWRRPFTNLAEGTPSRATLIVMNPPQPLTEGEAKALARWLETGGQLILAIDGEWKVEVSARQALPKGFLETNGMALKPIRVSEDAGSIAQTKSVGLGRLIYIPDPYAFSNATLLRKPDNSVWLANQISNWGNTAFFDEYHQGFGAKRSLAEILGLFFFSPWGAVCLQFGLAGVIYLFGYKRRLGRPVEELPVERTSPVEAIRALAGLFESARARALSAGAIHQYLNVSLSTVLGYRFDMLHEKARERAAGRSSLSKEVLDAYAANVKVATAAQPITDSQLTEIGRQASIISRSFSHGVATRKWPTASR